MIDNVTSIYIIPRSIAKVLLVLTWWSKTQVSINKVHIALNMRVEKIGSIDKFIYLS